MVYLRVSDEVKINTWNFHFRVIFGFVLVFLRRSQLYSKTNKKSIIFKEP